MDGLIAFCKYFYDVIYIPLYIFENSKIVRCFPPQPEDYHPPQEYLDKLWDSSGLTAYVETAQHTSFGMVRVTDSTYGIVVGPTSAMRFNVDILKDMQKEYIIDSSHVIEFYEFFQKIPQQNQAMFLNILSFICYAVNKIEVKLADFYQANNFLLNHSIKVDSANILYQAKEQRMTQSNYDIEKQLVKYVETGDLEKLEELSRIAKNTPIGIVANDNLRHLKNTFMVTVTLVSRAAINGGVDPSAAYALSDSYSQHMERLTSSDSILSLLYKVQHEFCSLVADVRKMNMYNNMLGEIIEYVHKNTNTDLKVEDIAKHFGFNRPHLSRKFSKTLGFSLGAFILRCKLEESKNLLAYTNKSISQISSYFCFSSQSHFQNAFKRQYGVTPNQYRAGNTYK